MIESIFATIGISPATAVDLAFPIPGLGAIARFAGETAWNAANAAVDAAVTDFSNLKASGFGVMGASAVTAADLLGRALGSENLQNALEGKNRGGDHLSGWERTVQGGAVALNVGITALFAGPALKAAGAAIWSTGANAFGKIGLEGVAAVEAEVIETASSITAAERLASSSLANEGIYEFTAASGKTYVGQSGNISQRIARQLSDGKLLEADLASLRTTEVLGGKVEREIAEQLRIIELGGVKNLENIRNPIGPARAHLLPESAKDFLGFFGL
ncbi:MAG: hypothetical protein HY288_07430 [Planctomycetia bacterium]|nr:hypothetical protein [Planctomycetia bacterium]